MTTKHPFRKRLAACFLLAAISAGCSYTAAPRSVPLIPDAETRSMAGIWVMVANAQKDDSLLSIPGSDRETSYIKANRQVWSRKLVESLARELARRGASVRAGAPITLNVALPEIVFIETRDSYQFRVKAAVSSARGWSKEYTGVAGVTASSVFSVKKETDRLAGQALANLIKEMLGDDEFLRQLRTLKS